MPSGEWIVLDLPVRHDDGRADDLAQVLQASPVSALADSEQTLPSPERVLDKDAVV
jgi:hypothetical protein